jgi:hypothetical protein
MNIEKELKTIEKKAIALAMIDCNLVDTFLKKELAIIDKYEKELQEKELQEKEKIFINAMNEKIEQLKKIDISLIEPFLISNNLTFIDNKLVINETKNDVDKLNFNDTANLTKKLFKLCKNTRTIGLAYELAQNKTINEKALQFNYNNGYVEYLFFHTILHNLKQFNKIFTLSNVLSFVNKHNNNKNYNSSGHFNYLFQIAKKVGIK